MAAKNYGMDKKQIALCEAMVLKYPKGIKTNNVVSSTSTLISFTIAKTKETNNFTSI